MKFHIITVGRDVEPWLERCLKSAEQVGQEFNVCVVDDDSDDNSAGIGKEICDAKGWAHVANKERMGGLYNQVLAVDTLAPAPEDVCLVLDADDQLAHDGVLNRLAVEYADPTVGLTYGTYRSDPFSPTCTLPVPYPQEVIESRSFRKYAYTGQGLCWNHLRTWRHAPFANIDRDLRFKWPTGEWFDRGQDYAIMFPLLEMLGPNHRFIPDELYVYNSENPNSEWRIASSEIDRVSAYILRTLPPQEPFTW